MAMEEEEEPKEEEGSVPTNPSSPPSSSLTKVALSPPPGAPGRKSFAKTGAQPPSWGARGEILTAKWRSTLFAKGHSARAHQRSTSGSLCW
ncbi:hypothetical protein LR48_Vigan1086s000700 [Vigna angularis]|uniref:Uncharacterized protein n=1 Tax=Phaseolus angularis TaxID=3914 RepID=A0A0L9TIK8_PHAAN|nr:hypothetical protein LR48_Vigan1086s000700 [Vigna angularis]